MSTFLTCNEIAKEALARLQSNLVLGNLVNRNYDNEFSHKGAIVQVKKPATFTATGFSSTTAPEAIEEAPVNVTLDTIADVSVEVTSKEMTLNVADFGTQVLEGMMQAIAQKIDTKIAGLYKDIPYFHGLGDATPDGLDDISGCMKLLNQNKAPFPMRQIVLNATAHAGLSVLDAIVGVDKSGSPMALREASMGKLLGLESYIDQNIAEHTRGTFVEASGNIVCSASAAATTVKLTNASCTGTLLIGDAIKVTTTTGKVSYHVVTANASSGTNDIDIAIYPAVPYTWTAAIVLINGKALNTSPVYSNSLAFHKDAFCLAVRPMALPIGGAQGAIINYNGLAIRVTYGYDMATKKNLMSADCLFGVKTLSAERCVRLLGNR